MKALVHAVSFFLVCATAYYIAKVLKLNEELALDKHSERSQSSQEHDSPAHTPLQEPSEWLQDVAKAWEHDADVRLEVPKDEEEEEVKEEEEEVKEDEGQEKEDEEEVKEDEGQVKEDEEEVKEEEKADNWQPNPLARGWGDNLDWVGTYEEGLTMCKSSRKPLMVIHHLENCPSCKSLKAAFSDHEEIQRMAKEEFIVFNLMHETKDPNLVPDGYYVPRILFVDPSMIVRVDIKANDQQFRYSYTDKDLHLLLENMKKAKTPLSTP